jgi:hypothetical protein
MIVSISAIFNPISANTFSAGKPRGLVTGGAFRPEGMYPKTTTMSAPARCLQVEVVARDFPAAATRPKPFAVPV